MYNLIKRFFNFIRTNIYSFLLKFKNPIKLTEKSICELKNNYNESLNGLAEIKSTIIKIKRKIEEKKQIATDYERNALVLLQKAQNGEITQEVADDSAIEALCKKNNVVNEVIQLLKDLQNYENMAKKIENKIFNLEKQISNWESELKILKARYKVAKSNKKINQQLASINSESATMLQDMRKKVQEEENLADAYAEMIYFKNDIDKEISNAISTDYSQNVQKNLLELKSKISTNKNSSRDIEE